MTETRSNLIRLLKACGLDMEATVATVGLCRTDENRQTMIDWIIEYYDKHGTISEQTIQRMGLYLTGTRKDANKQE